MGNRAYNVNEKMRVNLELDITVNKLVNSDVLSEERQQDILQDIKKEIGAHLSNRFSTSYSQEEVVASCDFISYGVNARVDERIAFLREAVEVPLNKDTIGELTVFYLHTKSLDDFLEEATLISLTPERYDSDQLKKLIARFKNG
jgi:hypothetical protein